MILISITLMLKAKAKPVNKAHKGMIRTYEDESGELYTYSYRIFTGIVIAFFVGLLGGLFGIGGGSLMVPAMMLLFLFPPKVAVATSMLIIFLSSVTGSVSHIAEAMSIGCMRCASFRARGSAAKWARGSISGCRRKRSCFSCGSS